MWPPEWKEQLDKEAGGLAGFVHGIVELQAQNGGLGQQECENLGKLAREKSGQAGADELKSQLY